MVSHSLPEAEEKPIAPLWKAIESVAKLLSETKRHYSSLQPDESGRVLLGENNFFPVLDDPTAEDHNECFVIGLVKDKEGNTLVSVNTYETTGMGDFIGNIYLGDSVAEAVKAASVWAETNSGWYARSYIEEKDFASALNEVANRLGIDPI